MRHLLSLLTIILQAIPIQADKLITKRLQEALALIDVSVIDHIIIGEDNYSMAEHGML